MNLKENIRKKKKPRVQNELGKKIEKIAQVQKTFETIQRKFE